MKFYGEIVADDDIVTKDFVEEKINGLASETYVDNKVADYLPLAGGTVTGDISLNGAGKINQTTLRFGVDNAANYCSIVGVPARLQLTHTAAGNSQMLTMTNLVTALQHGSVQLLLQDGIANIQGAPLQVETPTANNHAATKGYADTAVAALQSQIDALGEPFRVKNFSGSNYNVKIPFVTENISNTAIPNIDLSISDTEGEDYQIAGMLAYEMFDINNQRINCMPVCQFTQNTQKTLRIRMMAAGTGTEETRPIIKRIACWVLLKHR